MRKEGQREKLIKAIFVPVMFSKNNSLNNIKSNSRKWERTVCVFPVQELCVGEDSLQASQRLGQRGLQQGLQHAGKGMAGRSQDPLTRRYYRAQSTTKVLRPQNDGAHVQLITLAAAVDLRIAAPQSR